MLKISTVKISVAGEIFELNNRRSLFWEKEKMLVISDLHVGKTAHFRKNGIAVPREVLEKDLARLADLLNFYDAEKLLINGDLLHAGNNSDVDFFCSWKSGFTNVEFHLVEGNHDRISSHLADKLCLTTRNKVYETARFSFIHEFEKDREKFQITGHIHPGKIFRTTVASFRLPCFVLTENQLLLPAFSEFTGLDTFNLPKNAEIFGITDSGIFKV